MQIRATTVNAHKVMLPNQIRKLLVNKSTWIFYAKAISIVQQMLNVLKVNAFVKMVSNHKDLFALISMNVEQMQIFAANDQFVLIHLAHIVASAPSEFFVLLFLSKLF